MSEFPEIKTSLAARGAVPRTGRLPDTAVAIAWYAMGQWLQNFAYRTPLLPWTFLLAGLLSFLIALLTVSYKTVRAARGNPVETLRYE